MSVSLRLARYVDEIDRRGAYQVHLGSAVVEAKITGIDRDIAVFQLQSPMPLAIGDRYVLRDTGRKLVVGGGRVIDPDPGPVTKALAAGGRIDPSQAPNQLADTLLAIRGTESKERLARQTRGGVASGVSRGDVVISEEAFERLSARASRIVAAEHEDHPLRTGISIATLAERLGVNSEVADLIIDSSDDLERIGPEVAIAGREIEVPSEAERHWTEARGRIGQSLAVPTVDQLDIDPELLHLKVRTGDAVRVRDFVWLPDQINQIKAVIADMPAEFTVADFRDATNLSRKYAVPLLEWADAEGLTVRRGDHRIAR